MNEYSNVWYQWENSYKIVIIVQIPQHKSYNLSLSHFFCHIIIVILLTDIQMSRLF